MRTALALGFALLLSTSCVAPVVQEAGTSELNLERLPAGSQVVEIPAADVTLRGVFVPAPGDAPLVLHFLPSGVSITTGLSGVAGMRETLTRLHELGWSSLVVDYRGVGASDGRRDPRALPEDAAAMWRDALERVGGRPERIVLRAASVGGLASGSLVKQGARPAGWVLFAPVLPDTVARRGARRRYGGLLATLASPFLRAPVRMDLTEVLAHSSVPTLVVLAESDELLPEPDRARVLDAVRRGGHESVVLPLDHAVLILRAYGFESTAFSGRLQPELLEAEARFLSELSTGP